MIVPYLRCAIFTYPGQAIKDYHASQIRDNPVGIACKIQGVLSVALRAGLSAELKPRQAGLSPNGRPSLTQKPESCFYTAAADSDGSLGGLVELGKLQNLGRLLHQALDWAPRQDQAGGAPRIGADLSGPTAVIPRYAGNVHGRKLSHASDHCQLLPPPIRAVILASE